MKRTIVLIHGMWVTSLSWEKFAAHYQQRGHSVLTPAWPGLDRSVEDIRVDPSPLVDLGLTETVDHYDDLIRNLEEEPILIGHSFGGLIVQQLLDRGLGAAGVAIDSAPPKGVLRVPSSTLKANWFVLSNPANRHRAVAMTFDQFWYAFANTMNEEDARAAFERHVIPGSGRMVFQAAYANLNPKAASKVNYGNADRAPLLLIAGGSDNIIPPSVNRANAGKYTGSKAVTKYQEFPGRSHFIIGQEGWQEVADYAIGFASSHAAPIAAPARRTEAARSEAPRQPITPSTT